MFEWILGVALLLIGIAVVTYEHRERQQDLRIIDGTHPGDMTGGSPQRRDSLRPHWGGDQTTRRPRQPAVGEGPTVPALYVPEPPQQSEPAVHVVYAKVTAYCPCERCCGRWADGKTATNRDASLPGAAVAPTLIPYYSRIRIPGIDQPLLADDTGGAMRQAAKRGEYHIDVRMPTHEAAKAWGVKWLHVTIEAPRPGSRATNR